MAEGPLAGGVRLIPKWLQWVILAVAVSTFVSGWATTLLVYQDAKNTGQHAQALMGEVNTSSEETRMLGLCLVEQFAEHRNDNRSSHDALSDAHGIALPSPPASLPKPREEVEKALIRACEPYLDLRPDGGD